MTVTPYVSEGVGHLPVLTHGEVVAWALVDPDVLERLAEHEWHLHSGGYVVRQSRRAKRQAIFLHREVLCLEPGSDPAVRFRDPRSPLDCRRSNLDVSQSWLTEQIQRDPQLRATVTAVALGTAAASRRSAA